MKSRGSISGDEVSHFIVPALLESRNDRRRSEFVFQSLAPALVLRCIKGTGQIVRKDWLEVVADELVIRERRNPALLENIPDLGTRTLRQPISKKRLRPARLRDSKLIRMTGLFSDLTGKSQDFSPKVKSRYLLCIYYSGPSLKKSWDFLYNFAEWMVERCISPTKGHPHDRS